MLACTTQKAGRSCVFMRRGGCSYNGGRCHPIVEDCQGCENIEVFDDKKFCKIFAEPGVKWSLGPCNMATHFNRPQKNNEAQRINPLKASKRRAR